MNPSRARSLSLLLSVVGGGLALMFAGQTWLTAHRSDGGTDVSVTGAQLLGVLTPATFAVLLVALGIMFVPASLRRLLALALLAAIGVLIGLAIVVASNPSGFLDSAAIRTATGLTGDPASYISSVDLTAMPWLTVGAFALALIGAGLAVVTSPRWPDRGQVAKAASERAAKSQHVSRIETWDELSSGDDPTTDTGETAAPR